MFICFNISDISDFNSIANRSFEIISPADLTFNSSYTEIKVEDIYAPNVSITFEDDYNRNQLIYRDEHAASFTVGTDSPISFRI